MGRYPLSKNEKKNDTGLKKGAWSAEEDQKLIAYIQRYGIWNWTYMPKAAGKTRSINLCCLTDQYGIQPLVLSPLHDMCRLFVLFYREH